MIEVCPDEIKHAVESQYGGAATLVQSISVSEMFRGKPVWEGIVHVFDLAVLQMAADQQTSGRCAGSYRGGAAS